jgi:hypothetical protein
MWLNNSNKPKPIFLVCIIKPEMSIVAENLLLSRRAIKKVAAAAPPPL